MCQSPIPRLSRNLIARKFPRLPKNPRKSESRPTLSLTLVSHDNKLHSIHGLRSRSMLAMRVHAVLFPPRPRQLWFRSRKLHSPLVRLLPAFEERMGESGV